MKNFGKILPLWFAAALFLAGCTTSPAPIPKGPQPIYDENGNILWQPLPSSGQRPPSYPPSDTADSSPDDRDAYDGYEDSEEYDKEAEETARPAPRIGSGESLPRENGESGGDDHLLAAVSPLAEQAEKQMHRGELDRAYATAERAVRIDPDNAQMWNLMARIQFKKENYSQAEQLARKSNLHAQGNRPLQSQNWKIIAAVLSQKGQEAEARKALERAGELE